MLKTHMKKLIVSGAITCIFLVSLICGAAAYYEKEIAGFFSRSSSLSSEDIAALLQTLPPWVTEEILITSLELQEQYGIYASVTIAQAQQEVGGTWNGTSLYNTASVDFNLFGLKASGGISTWNGEITWDGTRGGTGTYRKYISYSQGLKDRARLLLTSSAYAAVAETAINRAGSQAQLQALSASPWCENQYSTLNNFMIMYNLARLDSITIASLQGGSGSGNFNGTFVYYNQADPRWGSLPYVRGSTIKNSGCAACCLAMIWATYGGNTDITPATVFSIGNRNGALVDGWLSRDGCVNATNSNFIYGCTAVHKKDWNLAFQALDKGGAVMVVGSGQLPFSARGHWFVIIGYSGNTAYLADPGHRACTWTSIGGNSSGESLNYIKSATQDMIIFTPR